MKRIFGALTALILVAGAALPGVAYGAFPGFGMDDPGILPVSPLYFLKEWRRDLMRSVAREGLSTVSLEFRIWNEVGAEVEKVRELKDDDSASMEEAFEAYLGQAYMVAGSLEEFAEGGGEVPEDIREDTELHAEFVLDSLWRYGENDKMGKMLEKAGGTVRFMLSLVNPEQ